MIRQYLFIDKYDWRLTVLYNANRDLSIVAEELLKIKCPSDIAVSAIKNIVGINNGFCFTNDLLKATLVGIAETDSDEELINTIAHEVSHVKSHICTYYKIDEKSEEAAYLMGDILEKLFKIFKYELGRT